MGAFAEPRLSNTVVMIVSRNTLAAAMKQICSIAGNSLHSVVCLLIFKTKQIIIVLPHKRLLQSPKLLTNADNASL